jgi:hypothetical protein
MSGTGDMKKDFETKYSDEIIKRLIGGAQGKHFDNANSRQICALALIAYNNMIDQRWVRYHAIKLDDETRDLLIEQDESEE